MPTILTRFLCSYHIFPSRSQGVALFKAASSPSGLQLPVLFKTFGLHLRSTSRGDQSGTCSCSAVCPCGGHLVLHLASTVRGFGASISPISTARASWGQPSMAGALSCHTPLLHLSPQQRAVRLCVARGSVSRLRVSGGGGTRG